MVSYSEGFQHPLSIVGDGRTCRTLTKASFRTCGETPLSNAQDRSVRFKKRMIVRAAVVAEAAFPLRFRILTGRMNWGKGLQVGRFMGHDATKLQFCFFHFFHIF